MEESGQSEENFRISAVPDAKEILDLIKKCGNGNPGSLSIFFERFASDIYNFPIKVFHLDEDSASDFFLYAYERLRDGGRFRSFQGRSSFRTWFYTVLRNLVIDWMRTIREVRTVNFRQNDEKGSEYRVIENTPDPRAGKEEDTTRLQAFRNRIAGLGMELRLIFKLSYVYYMDLEKDELEFLSEKTGKSTAELIKYTADLRHFLSEKEIKNLDSEDKITGLYVNIMDLKSKREKLQSLVNRPGPVPDQLEISRLNKSLEKKYNQREKLLNRREKGHFIVRTPYRYLSDLLGIPEGSVSVQMMRALEKIRESSPEFEENDRKL